MSMTALVSLEAWPKTLEHYLAFGAPAETPHGDLAGGSQQQTQKE